MEDLEKRKKIKELQAKLVTLTVRELRDFKHSLNIKKGGKNKSELIDAIISSIEEYEVSLSKAEEKLKKYLEHTKKERKPTRRGLTKDDLKILKESILLEISEQNKYLRLLSKKVDQLEDILRYNSELLSRLNELTKFDDEKFMNFFQALKKINPKIEKTEDINNLLKKLNLFKVSPMDVIKLGTIAVILSQVIDISREFDAGNNIGTFYAIIKSESSKVKSIDGIVPIYKLRKQLLGKLNISKEEFDRKLGECFRRGWLTLDFRRPIGEEDVEYATIDGKNYYIIRAFNR